MLIIVFLVLLFSVILYLYQKRDNTKPLLILDMNNVLVARAFIPKLQEEYPDFVPHVSSASILGKHYTWKVPQLEEILDALFRRYTLAVWSSAWKENVSLLCEHVFGERRKELLFEWNQQNCEPVSSSTPKPIYRKNLSEVWKAFPQYQTSNTFIVDDSAEKMVNNPKSCVVKLDPWYPWQNSVPIKDLM